MFELTNITKNVELRSKSEKILTKTLPIIVVGALLSG
jgi:hypothetical protein